VQQNSLNLTCDNSETLIIRHLRRTVGLLHFTRKKIHQCNRHASQLCSKRPPRVSVRLPLWYLLTPSPTTSTSSAMKTLENAEEDFDHPEPAD